MNLCFVNNLGHHMELCIFLVLFSKLPITL